MSALTVCSATHAALGVTVRPRACAATCEIIRPLSITATLETNSVVSTIRLRRDVWYSRSRNEVVMRTVHSQLMTRWNNSGTITAMLSHSWTASPVSAGLYAPSRARNIPRSSRIRVRADMACLQVGICFQPPVVIGW